MHRFNPWESVHEGRSGPGGSSNAGPHQPTWAHLSVSTCKGAAGRSERTDFTGRAWSESALIRRPT